MQGVCQSVQSEGTVLTRHPSLRTRAVSSGVPGLSSRQISWLQIPGSPQLPLGLIIHQDNSQNSGKHYAYDYSFHVAKGCKLEPAKEEAHRVEYGRLPLSSEIYPPPSIDVWLSTLSIAQPRHSPKPGVQSSYGGSMMEA